MLNKRVIAAVAAALMAGSASAVDVSREGTGDFLFAPAYFIGGGMTTDLKVINTSQTQSAVAKVVFRHPVTSAEILDFLIYLSPSDVWNGTVSCEAADVAGNCSRSVVTSADDSIQLVNSATFASAANPAVIVSDNATAAGTGRVALPNQGYIEVIMGSAYDVAPFRPGVLKTNVLAAHTAAGAFVGVAATPNVLTGVVTANAPGIGAASLPMVALADYDNSVKVDVGIVSGLDVAGQRTSVADVEEALWTNNVAIPYAVGAGKLSLTTFTFPTKLSYTNTVAGVVGPTRPGQFSFLPKTCISAAIFDNSENTIAGNIFNISPLPVAPQTCLDEFQWMLFGSNIATGSFTDGWARISFVRGAAAVAQVSVPTDSTNVGRVGVPALVTYMVKEPNKFTWAYAASTR